MRDKYQVLLTKKAQKDFQKLDPSLQKPILKTILDLCNNQKPQQFTALKGKNIAQFRVRVGDYRVLYDIYDEDKTILIFRIGHRKDIYR
ncbi:type II toxin-antitoxin system mRNA interferase toxin, RelE/StbE family [Candidatus Roizmanbacteria bacterium CG_4_9_14_0_2_um_filter_39_13]|uniref:Type II toxin-antitoxin system mRNA interferase toxin, RelE/StbE family n=1 Tax=Candidatus Roizmanbacteria bacterium CG_4_9_14_0_2_um_filter_39_13 TaxID=1974839 RepID=A0A2M8EYQ1_9BACT|nr:MAG: type II toxin-antitoxin system mRNA interferase toxin, RelE/StbE family [Candidatus Roizmanbacteria bacterium CG_4_10_14_0_2_um_filter_39_12]PJC31699.1 MAG: type II toxin-antitoxin system mRNA interferase toxin, RelE/StbE family [Candidatus Roizmanbacteria bacterium CG_4_9_14_0_2_um_filter_39_13]